MRNIKSSQGVSAPGVVGLPPRAGSTTPKPAGGGTGVNVPPPPGVKAAGKTLPKKSPIVGAAVLVKEKKEKDITASPEKMRKTMSNGSVGGAGGTKPKMKIAKAGGGGGKGGGIAGKSVPVLGKRAVGVGGAAGGGGDGEGGVPRKRPKVGGD